MEFQLPIQISSLPQPIEYTDKIMLTGSCFTEHIGNHLRDLKFDTLQNPNGILFDPASVAGSIVSYIQHKTYREEDLFYFNELWQSWQHHSVFSGMDRTESLRVINESQARAHDFLKEAKWLIITLGSAFSYRLVADAPAELRPGGSNARAEVRPGAFSAPPEGHSGAATGNMAGSHPSDVRASDAPAHDGPRPPETPVANCHRVPAQHFRKHLMTIEEINSALDNCLHQLFHFNPSIGVIFTVSPVRHIRDGVIENNRSKARLIEVVHHLTGKFDRLWYFPAYELVIDVLRDYRFYDIDLVHPNYAATNFVLEKFTRHFIGDSSQQIMEEVKKIAIARKHKPFQPATLAHKRFLLDHWQKTKDLIDKYPFLHLEEELDYFSRGGPFRGDPHKDGQPGL
ncbi:MAG TPA: GSCFA domain-containing protein [Puia sp.]|nr:GSCFA domain-containing protein [Puia sp.]